MRSTHLCLLFVPVLALVFTSCERGYVIEDDKVFFTSWNAANGDLKYEVIGSDAASFETIEHGGNGLFGKDKNYVYHESTIIQNVDPKTFEEIGNYYFRTKDSIYYFGSYGDINECEVKNIGSPKIELMKKEPWAKAGSYIICEHNASFLEDIDTFEAIDSEWGKTKTKVVWIGHILEGVDVATFTPIDRYTGKDKSGQFLAEDRLR
jgi:hypothetical protein